VHRYQVENRLVLVTSTPMHLCDYTAERAWEENQSARQDAGNLLRQQSQEYLTLQTIYQDIPKGLSVKLL
jgi:hypothetical protein